VKAWGRLGFLSVLVTALVACSSAQPAAQAGAQSPKPGLLGASQPPLASAIGAATRLGPAGSTTEVHLSLGLKVRDQARLAALLAAGGRVSPGEYAAEFGADPALVRQAVAVLEASGLAASWQPGSSLIQADGPAPAASALLRVDIEEYRLPDGTTFYATLERPYLEPRLALVVAEVTGLDSYRRARIAAVRPGGMKPTDVLLFYNLQGLRDRGLDGSGQTVLFPELDDLPNLNDLNKFAGEFGLPAYDSLLTVKRDPSWGTPEKPQGEAALDLELVHEIAPKAKLVVYMSGPQFSFLDRAFDRMVTDNLGSIISESLGACEAEVSSGHRDLSASIQDRAVAQGISHFVATGDSGAYTCGQNQPPAAAFPSTLPTVTAVGGTTVFESQSGAYYRESAWGGPVEEAGTGGGPSIYYPVPDWQKSVAQSMGHGNRQVPDVSADADPNTGYHIVFGGNDIQIGGTSASTPVWAGTVALINQDLKAKGMREVGFANPALYWMGVNQSKFPAKPFHDVTTGNNLAYEAGQGWDFATGWGSMDGVALDQAWALYIKGGGA
jgi:kumamolisin